MKKVFSISLFFMLIVSISVFAETKTLKEKGAIGGVSWNSIGSWDPTGVPADSDDVVIPAISTILNIDVDAVCASFTIDSGYSGTITFVEPFTLTVNGDWNNNLVTTLAFTNGLLLIASPTFLTKPDKYVSPKLVFLTPFTASQFGTSHTPLSHLMHS